MKKSFDQSLTEKIKSTFDSYEEPYNPEHWEMLRNKLHGKKAKIVFFVPFWAKAASVLIILGLSSLFYFSNSDRKSRTAQEFNSFTSNNKLNNPYNQQIISGKQNNFIKIGSSGSSITFVMPSVVVNNLKNLKNIIDSNIAQDLNDTNQLFTNQKNDRVPIINSINDTTLKVVMNEKRVKKETVKNKKKVIYDDQMIAIIPVNPKKEKIKVGLTLSTLYSYANVETTSKMNVGGGIVTELPLSKHVSFNTGLIAGRQNLEIKDGQTAYSLFSLATKNNESQLFAGSKNTISQSKKMEIVALDVPLNLQVNFHIKKTLFYLSSGVSSLVYLNSSSTEEIAGVLNDGPDNMASYNTTNYQRTETDAAFSRFDFAKLYNLAIGYKVPMKKGMLVMEPYLKYPISSIFVDGLGIGYGGINLRYNFGK